MRVVSLALLLVLLPQEGPPKPDLTPLLCTLDLDVGEAVKVELSNGEEVKVKLLEIKESRDPIRDAVREALVTIEVEGEKITLPAAQYNLPRTVGKVLIDCTVTSGYLSNTSHGNEWGLRKAARLRLWPAGSPLVRPRTMVCPIRQRWMASHTCFSNEPVDNVRKPFDKTIYYHYGLDFGGVEGMVEIAAATDGLVVSSAGKSLPWYKQTPTKPRGDVIYIVDPRGWYYRYSHLQTIEKEIRPGAVVRAGQKLGLLGKEGASGGWSHLHFEIRSRQPSGEWGIQESYALLWEAYRREHKPKLKAIAKPHHYARAGTRITLDARRSWSEGGKPLTFDWILSDDLRVQAPTIDRVYMTPGTYSEILKVTDEEGNVDYDEVRAIILHADDPNRVPPVLVAHFHPTEGIRPGDPVTFTARIRGTADGEEKWDFGDGSPPETTKSQNMQKPLAKDGYAKTLHRFEKPGDYIVTVERTDGRGLKATVHLFVRVEE